MKNIVTEYTELSAFSARPKECTHHLIYGKGLRELADRDGLTLPLCHDEHNICRNGDPTKLIHGNAAAEKLSKMLGQEAWEAYHLSEILAEIKDVTPEEIRAEAREAFRRRYGISYL